MTREELGNILASLRKGKGYTIRELADRCELNKATIVNIEQGRFSPKFESVVSIINKLDATIEIKAKRSAE